MKIVKNEKLYNRNGKFGMVLSLAGMGLLIVAMIIAFFYVDYLVWSFTAMAMGFILSQVGLFMGNRWGRNPNPASQLNTALKGLDDRFAIYHYPHKVGAAHFMISPAGLWALIPKYQKGVITYDEKKKRWNQKGGNLYLKLFGQEGLGRPDIDIEQEVFTLHKYLKKKIDLEEIPEIHAALVFTNEEAYLDADNAPHPTLHANKLKDFMRKKSKEKLLSMPEVERLNAIFQPES